MSGFFMYNDKIFTNITITSDLAVGDGIALPLETNTSIPTSYNDKGKIAYDLQNSTVMCSNGTIWSDLGPGTVTTIVTGTGLTGGPITSTGTISIANTNVIPDVYSYPSSITVNPQGQITSISPGTGGGSGTVTSIGTTSDLTVNGTPGATLT